MATGLEMPEQTFNRATVEQGTQQRCKQIFSYFINEIKEA